jgi:hypothetical protein
MKLSASTVTVFDRATHRGAATAHGGRGGARARRRAVRHLLAALTVGSVNIDVVAVEAVT